MKTLGIINSSMLANIQAEKLGLIKLEKATDPAKNTAA